MKAKYCLPLIHDYSAVLRELQATYAASRLLTATGVGSPSKLWFIWPFEAFFGTGFSWAVCEKKTSSPPPRTSVKQLHQFICVHVQQLIKVHSSVCELAEGPFLCSPIISHVGPLVTFTSRHRQAERERVQAAESSNRMESLSDLEVLMQLIEIHAAMLS